MKNIIIAGASQGVGGNLAQHLINKGYGVILLARNQERLNLIQSDLKTKHENASIQVHPIDLTDAEATSRLFEKIASSNEGKIAGLINCASTWTGGISIHEISSEKMLEAMKLNYFTYFNPIKALISLPENALSKPLNIVNLGATASTRGGNKMAAFAVPKSAVRILSQSLARELAPEKIHVSHLIIDGLIDNPRTHDLNPELPDDSFIKMDSLSKEVLHLMEQNKDCWTFESDVRPHVERW